MLDGISQSIFGRHLGNFQHGAIKQNRDNDAGPIRVDLGSDSDSDIYFATT